MQRYCYICNKELDSLVPWKCKYCSQYFCGEHRLPEHHSCNHVKVSWNDWKENQNKFQKTTKPDVNNKPIIAHSKKSHHKSNKKKYKSRKRKYGFLQTFRYKIRKSKFPIWFIAIFTIMILIAIIHQFYMIKILSFDLSIIFYILEIILVAYLMFMLMCKLDRIHVGSDMRLFGLRFLSGIVAFFGFCIFFLILLAPVFAIFDTGIAGVIYFGSSFHLPLTGLVLYSVFSFGLMIIGAYLFFKFQRRTGEFVWFGRIR
jgi:hypothetical protein